MRIPRSLLALVIGVTIVALGGLTASAQTGSDYRFLDVTDTAGKPVVAAKVETVGSGGVQTAATDEKGAARIEIIAGDYNTHALRVSKTGFETEEVTVSFYQKRTLLDDELPVYDPHRPIPVVLLRQPARVGARDPDQAERRRKELVGAVLHNLSSVVENLLRAGVSPDTTDQDGIPIILWASVSKYPEVLRALLAAGADVKKPTGLGRKALLYYLIHHSRSADVELVRELIRAGADMNVRNRSDVTPLSAAEYTKDAKLIDLVKRAGATAK